ncbi:MAG: ketopantoate reductase family protein [Anaerolineae bacterium]|nr:ketopantoate reductase family protein [Anaerolineae bacterium]
MKILVYGAGPLGSVFAAKLHQAGHEVSILARGQRLSEIREHGVVIHNIHNDEWITAPVQVVERLDPDDAYDLVMIIMRKNRIVEILPALAANHNTPNVLFMANNAAGPQEWVTALGKERVLTGFPSSAGYRDGHVMQCLTGTVEKPMTIPIGEVDGQIRERTQRIAEALSAAPGFAVEIRTDMDAWHKYHVALLMPALAPALFACGTDRMRMSRTRDAVVLAIRGVHEGFRVLRAKGVPITPPSLRMFARLPEPIMTALLRFWIRDLKMEIALVGHANAARDELKHLADEFLDIARTTTVPTPNIERLYSYFDPATPLIPDGSQEIPLDWREVIIGAGALLGGLLGMAILIRSRKAGRQQRKCNALDF